MQAVRKLDIFPKFDSKFEHDAREKTLFGATLSIVALILIACLCVGEFRYFMSSTEKHELFVDEVVGGDMDIEVNVSFPQVPCDLMTLDAVNAFGEFQDGMDKKTIKHRINANLEHISKARPMENEGRVATTPTDDDGKPIAGCQSCYGAELNPGQCCNTCDEVQEAYNRRGWHFNINDVGIAQCAKERLRHAVSLARHEGCNVYAKIQVARVQGNIHFIPGRAFTILGQHMHDLTGDEVAKLNLSHIIHTLQFGAGYAGLQNPLDDRANVLDQPSMVNGKFNYYVKVVPTTVDVARTTSGHSLETNQYSVTEHFIVKSTEELTRPGQQQQFVPGVFIVYDLSPIRVRIFESRPYSSVVHFLLQLCAIIGGVFTVMGLVDAVLHHSVIRVRRKLQLGKQI